jgi:hypothetical protein
LKDLSSKTAINAVFVMDGSPDSSDRGAALMRPVLQQLQFNV